MENDSTSDVIDTDAVTLEATEEPDAEVENPEEAGVETAEVIEASEDESEVQPATVETSGDKRTLSKILLPYRLSVRIGKTSQEETWRYDAVR